MKNARIIVVLALLALFLSGCANMDRSEVSAPSSQGNGHDRACTKHRAAGEHSGFCFGKYRDSRREYGPNPKSEKAKPEVSIPAKEETPPTVSSPTETTQPKASEPEPPEEPTETRPQEPEPPAAEEPTEPAFDIQTWIDYAKAYAESVGLRLESSAVDCWDNPIDAAADCIYLERDICSRLNRYAADETITDVWVWYEAVGTNSYLIYIGYA